MCYTGDCQWEDHQGDCQYPYWYIKEAAYPCPTEEELIERTGERDTIVKRYKEVDKND